MKKIIRNVAMAGLLAAGAFSGSAYAQTPVVAPLADLVAAVQSACVLTTPITAFADQSAACQAALRALLLAYPNDPTALALAVSYVGQDQVDLLLLETGSVGGPVLPPGAGLGGEGTVPGTPS